MIDAIFRGLAVATLCVTGVGCVGHREPTEGPATQLAGGPWRALFNGRDLDGWTTVGKAHWRVDSDNILGTQDGDPSLAGLLTTTQQFKDFELVLDFNIDEHGKYNSGVFLRNQPGAGHQTAYQVNIGRGVAGEYCGGLYRKGWLGKGDVNDVIRRPGQWNSLHIIADGPHILVDLNGARVVDYVDSNPEPGFLEPGVIALQTYGAENHPGWVRFRNIRIRELRA